MLSLKPEVAPVKCSVFPQMKSVGTVVCLQISEKLTALGISNAVRCPLLLPCTPTVTNSHASIAGRR